MHNKKTLKNDIAVQMYKWPSKERVRQLQDYYRKVTRLKKDRAYTETLEDRLLQKGNL